MTPNEHSLTCAVKLAISRGLQLVQINQDAWEQTYNTPGKLLSIWEHEAMKHSLKASAEVCDK